MTFLRIGYCELAFFVQKVVLFELIWLQMIGLISWNHSKMERMLAFTFGIAFMMRASVSEETGSLRLCSILMCSWLWSRSKKWLPFTVFFNTISTRLYLKLIVL